MTEFVIMVVVIGWALIITIIVIAAEYGHYKRDLENKRRILILERLLQNHKCLTYGKAPQETQQEGTTEGGETTDSSAAATETGT